MKRVFKKYDKFLTKLLNINDFFKPVFIRF